MTWPRRLSLPVQLFPAGDWQEVMWRLGAWWQQTSLCGRPSYLIWWLHFLLVLLLRVLLLLVLLSRCVALRCNDWTEGRCHASKHYRLNLIHCYASATQPWFSWVLGEGLALSWGLVAAATVAFCSAAAAVFLVWVGFSWPPFLFLMRILPLSSDGLGICWPGFS